MDKSTYIVATNVEDLDTGLVTLHQDSFLAVNRYEAIGRACDKWLDVGGNVIHSFKITVGGDGGNEISEYVNLIEEGKKIAAIKLFRENTGVGLKEAKDAIDNLIFKYDIKSHRQQPQW